MTRYRIHITLLLWLAGSSILLAQHNIKILNSEHTFSNPEKYPGAIVAIGNVTVSHEGAELHCDQALIYKNENIAKAFGNVVINQGDTITQTSKYVHYDGNSMTALSWGNVVLKDPKMTLSTDTLHFDRKNQILFYEHHATIRDSINTLESDIGKYFLAPKKFEALSRVTITNPDTRVTSDKLDYFPSTGESYLYGETLIENGGNKLYCLKGYHNSITKISHFTRNAKILYKLREIYGDSLFYDQNRKFASATGHIKVIDTVNHMTTTGGYSEYYENKDSVFITQRPALARKMDNDTLYIYGDTLLITGKSHERIMRAYHRVKFYKKDMQGACDSLYSNQAGGYTHMLGRPVLWNEGNQISGDTLRFFTDTKTNKLDSLSVIRNAFVINKDSIKGYNQLKGNLLEGKFNNGKLQYVRITGNAESLNYQRDEEQKLIGITHMLSGEIQIRLHEGKVETATYINSPEGKTYPESKFPNNLEKLKNFAWREDERPLTKEDIYPDK